MGKAKQGYQIGFYLVTTGIGWAVTDKSCRPIESGIIKMNYEHRAYSFGNALRPIKERHDIRSVAICEPNSSKTFAFELGTAWKDYTVKVESPAGVQPPDASRDPWQIIIRLKAHSGRVDFDAIRLSSADAQIGHKESAQLSPAQ